MLKQKKEEEGLILSDVKKMVESFEMLWETKCNPMIIWLAMSSCICFSQLIIQGFGFFFLK